MARGRTSPRRALGGPVRRPPLRRRPLRESEAAGRDALGKTWIREGKKKDELTVILVEGVARCMAGGWCARRRDDVMMLKTLEWLDWMVV